MEQRELFELISRFEASTLSALELNQGDVHIRLEKNASQLSADGGREKPAAPPAAEEQAVPQSSSSAKSVRSPIVGVYYAAPSPDEPPYVRIGDRVEKGQVLCLVEAMKMMNELKSPTDGIVKGIFGVNGELVEFDQVLFEVEPC